MKYLINKDIYTNKCQEKAIDILLKFVESDDDAITLKGRGGTGKTTIMNIFIKKLIEKKGNINIVLLAPTHKACNILESKTDYDVHTIASALGIELNESTGNFTINYDKKNNLVVKSADYIIVDESSMLSDKLLMYLLDCIHIECKCIFMGDNAQLPPIGQENDSEVFTLNIVELTEQMRQSDAPEILNICTLLANNIESDTIIERVINNRNSIFNKDKNKGVLFISDNKKFIQHYVNDFLEYPQTTKAITYNNQNNNSLQSVKNLNKILRKYITKSKCLDINDDYHIDEQLCCYDTLMCQKTDTPIIKNSVEYTVIEVNEKKHKTIFFSKNTKKGVDKMSLDLEFINCKLQNNLDTENYISIDLLTRESHDYVNKVKQQLILEERFPLYYAISNTLPNVEYGYAITTHKTQGSTYRNAYVLEDNILNQYHPSIKVKNQSLYVACSRASDKLVIFSEHN